MLTKSRKWENNFVDKEVQHILNINTIFNLYTQGLKMHYKVPTTLSSFYFVLRHKIYKLKFE